MLFTPDKSGRRVYNPKAFILHAASLRQAFAHSAIFPVAATRRCMGRVSVPFWGAVLSHPLPVFALVGHYPTNKLMGRRPFLQRDVTPFPLYQSKLGTELMRDYPRFLGAIPH